MSAMQLIFGEQDQFSDKKAVMIGVGGIGCELLKMMCKFNFKELHIVDMDTIEVSNLNRQFLFRKEHRGKFKAEVAKETMLTMAPQLKIVSHLEAVGVGNYRMDFLKQFDIVIMALDNQETRSYVNKVCRAMGIYLLDAGSMGFKGQSNQYLPHESLYCYDCFPLASTQKQYPACTIRQQPSNCVHCVIWSKYLFTQLFTTTPVDDDSNIMDTKHLDKKNPSDVFNKVFNEDVKLIKKELVYLQLSDFPNIPPPPGSRVDVEGKKKFPTEDLISMWFYSYEKLLTEQIAEFDKDDWIQTLFIFASTCLRCLNFSIEPQDYQQVKTICGNIVHAIASTNSLVSALEVSKMVNAIYFPYKSFKEPRGPSYVSTGKRERITTTRQQKRNPDCLSCSTEQYLLKLDLNHIKMGEVVSVVKKHFNFDQDVTFEETGRLVWDDMGEEDQLDVLKEKLLSGLLDVNKDNRIKVTHDDKAKIVIWIVHKEQELEFKFVPMSTQHAGFKVSVELKDLEQQRVIVREQRPVVNIQPTAKMISLSDSEDEKPNSKSKQKSQSKPKEQTQPNKNDVVIDIESD